MAKRPHDGMPPQPWTQPPWIRPQRRSKRDIGIGIAIGIVVWVGSIAVLIIAGRYMSESGGWYPDVDAVLAALNKAGVQCTSATPVPATRGELSMAHCSVGTDDDTVVLWFDTHLNAEAYAERMTGGSGPLPARAAVYGFNWAVTTPAAYAPRVRDAIGGAVLGVPGPSAS